MKTASFSDFRRHAAGFLDEVEKGEVIRVLRHGRPVADIAPIPGTGAPSWKKDPPRFQLHGASLSRAILENRRDSGR